MRGNGIWSKSHRKYKAATNSDHNLPAAQNILNRDFTAFKHGQKMVSDITYIRRMKASWDNAPMESFWGKLKQEWLNEQHFRTS